MCNLAVSYLFSASVKAFDCLSFFRNRDKPVGHFDNGFIGRIGEVDYKIMFPARGTSPHRGRSPCILNSHYLDCR